VEGKTIATASSSSESSKGSSANVEVKNATTASVQKQ
jgi:hypothetical protein